MKYKVLSYENRDTITNFLKGEEANFISDIPTSENKHFQYIENYFDYLGVKSLIFEFNYIDKDYLEDYSHYYAKCFRSYSKKCIRLHAFSKDVSSEEFINLITTNTSEQELTEFKSSYIGFIVFKPIPLTLFGRTCLTVYPSTSKSNPDETRYYPIIRDYKVNLFGLSLLVKSLAFQEQDEAVSACATSALWSAFQGTGNYFHHHYPSPSEITLSATKIITYTERSFPNNGLMIQQMAHAIREVDLEPVTIGSLSLDHNFLKAYINAFLKGNIPLIIGLELYDKRQTGDSKLGFHTVTVTGFCIDTSKDSIFNFLGNNTTKTEDSYDFFMRSSQISKIYVHDDQVGPFARMLFDGLKVNSISDSLSTTWSQLDPSRYTNVRAIPKVILIPLYNKIRIPFDTIFSIIIDFHSTVLVSNRICWDIYISTVNDYKSKIFNDTRISQNTKLKFLTTDFPKYLWVVDAFIDDHLTLSFIFDTTDLKNGQLILGAVHYEEDVYDVITDFTGSVEEYSALSNTSKNILDLYKKNHQAYIYKTFE